MMINYCLERDVTFNFFSTKYLCSNSVFLTTQLIFKLQEVNKEINKEYYKLVACQILTFLKGSTYGAVVPFTAIGFSKPH